MMKLADIVQRNQEVLATIESLDNGKPYSKAVGDIDEVYASPEQFYQISGHSISNLVHSWSRRESTRPT